MAEKPPEPSSPVCYAGEASDAYMGYATRDELIPFLIELLEAERAGARVGLKTAQETDDPAMKALFQAIQKDEAKWCRMLLRWIKHLEAQPSCIVGAFFEKAMAVNPLPERVRFLNRGQGWVVKKLREMLPKVRDDKLHADLKEMLESHVENIATAEAAIAP